MSTIEKLLKGMNDMYGSSVYLREIALLMEEIELLKDKVRAREKEIKNLLKYMKGKKQCQINKRS
tara:strand:- start:6 stop:200 length:195 start_codon:yes stop_codon:yes gene_type:complete